MSTRAGLQYLERLPALTGGPSFRAAGQGRLIEVSRVTVRRWVQQAVRRAACARTIAKLHGYEGPLPAAPLARTLQRAKWKTSRDRERRKQGTPELEKKIWDIYQLNYLLHEPAEDHGWMYRAEVPAPSGLRGLG